MKHQEKQELLYISVYYNNINLYILGIKMAQTQIKEKINHSPTLSTILMVEEVLKEAGEVITLATLKKKLPRKVMHQTLIQILDYLQISGKILIGTKGVLWIFTEQKELHELINRGTEL